MIGPAGLLPAAGCLVALGCQRSSDSTSPEVPSDDRDTGPAASTGDSAPPPTGTLEIENWTTEDIRQVCTCPLLEACDVTVYSGSFDPGAVERRELAVGRYIVSAWNDPLDGCLVEEVWIEAGKTTQWVVYGFASCPAGPC